MSHHSGNYGGQYPSKPLSTWDKIQIWAWAIFLLAVFFGPMILGVKWWVFG
mgnify:CR=1 FL=1